VLIAVSSEKVFRALNEQLNAELRNAYLYLAMASFFAEKGLNGFSHFFRVQAREELGHAMKIYDYILDRGGKVVLSDVPAPRQSWDSVLSAVDEFVRSEEENTQRIWRLVDVARDEGDKATEVFLNWFVEEQVEEEKLAQDLLAKVKLVGDNPAALLALDRELAKREE